MIQNMNEMKVACTALITALTAIWGWFGWLAILWIACMVVDYITGTVAACMRGEWSSKVARDGICHKVGCVIMVFAAGLTDLAIVALLKVHPEIKLPFDYDALLCSAVMIWYVITELGSITENAVKMGAPKPKILSKALAMLNEAVDDSEAEG